jgi:hypothetical protein
MYLYSSQLKKNEKLVRVVQYPSNDVNFKYANFRSTIEYAHRHHLAYLRGTFKFT